MLVFLASSASVPLSNGVIYLDIFKYFVITQYGYLLISMNVFLICLSSCLSCFSVEQLTKALLNEVFKLPHFQVPGAKEYQFIYKSVSVFFLYTVVSIFPGFLITEMS